VPPLCTPSTDKPGEGEGVRPSARPGAMASRESWW
jgi:hypothetical protein